MENKKYNILKSLAYSILYTAPMRGLLLLRVKGIHLA
jgi:hypothetical protein